MNGTLEFSKTLAESNLPFFDGTMMIWAGVFIVLSIIFSTMTWRTQTGLSSRALMYWIINALVFCLGIYFFTKAFPRLPSGWVLAGLFVMLFAVSGMTVATKSKTGSDKKEDAEKKN